MSRWVGGLATLALALTLAACSVEGATGTARIAVSVPEGGAPSGGIIRIRATKAGFSDLDLEVPVARHQNQAAVLGGMRFLMPAEWQEQTTEAGGALFIQAVESIDVNAGATGVDVSVTTTAAPDHER